jgi:hypothetical protein
MFHPVQTAIDKLKALNGKTERRQALEVWYSAWIISGSVPELRKELKALRWKAFDYDNETGLPYEQTL